MAPVARDHEAARAAARPRVLRADPSVDHREPGEGQGAATVFPRRVRCRVAQRGDAEAVARLPRQSRSAPRPHDLAPGPARPRRAVVAPTASLYSLGALVTERMLQGRPAGC